MRESLADQLFRRRIEGYPDHGGLCIYFNTHSAAFYVPLAGFEEDSCGCVAASGEGLGDGVADGIDVVWRGGSRGGRGRRRWRGNNLRAGFDGRLGGEGCFFR